MGVVKNQALKSTILTYLGIALAFLNKLIILPYALEPEDIGLIEVITSTSLILGSILTLGASGAFLKFKPYFLNLDKVAQFKGLLFSIISISISILIGFFIFLHAEANQILTYMDGSLMLKENKWLLVLCTASLVWLNLDRSISLGFMRSAIPDLLKEVVLRVFFFISISAFVFNLFSKDVFFQFYFLSFLIIAFILFFYNVYHDGLPKFFDRKTLKIYKSEKVMNFGFYNILTSINSIIGGHIDKIMISALLGIKSAGIYTLAYYIGTLVFTPKNVIGKNLVPLISGLWINGETDKIDSILKRSSNILLHLGSFVLVLILANIENLYALIPNGNIYYEGVFVVVFIGISKLIDMGFGVNSEIIGYSHKYHLNFYFSILQVLLIVVSNFIFIPLIGIRGAAFATLLTMFIMNCLRTLYLYFHFKMFPFSAETIKVLAVFIILASTSYFFPKSSNVLFNAFLKTSIISILFVISTFVFGLQKEFLYLLKKRG